MTMNSGFDREISFEIMEHIGVLSTYSTGWQKELNLVSWNGGQPKYDIRDWDMEHEHMSKGITLHEKEMRQIFDLMKKRRMESRFKREGGERRDEREAQAETPVEVAAEVSEEVLMEASAEGEAREVAF